MRPSPSSRRARVVLTFALGAAGAIGCTDRTPSGPAGSLAAPSAAVAPGAGGGAPDIAAAIAAQERYTAGLLRIPGVVGTAVGLLPNGRAAVQIFLARDGVAGVPATLDSIPVDAQVTGQFVAFSDPTTRQRPAPLGFSVGHPLITAGSIGARVIDAQARVFVLSNNHVLANSNNASIGDAALQPGPYDGGTSADQIGTLYAFKPIDFSGGSNNIDAAIALSSTSNLSNASPTDDGYGTPNGAIFGDANNDGTFDNKNALLNLNVQKYGRTTKLTKGQITGINGTVTVCYEVYLIFCLKSATYSDQLIVSPGAFSGGGDSGSLIVSDDAGKNPVGLLFAGSSTQTIANRIDLVLNYFGVRVDGSASVPPPPLTDVAISSVSAPSSVTQGSTVNVGVTVRNVGNQPVSGPFNVSLMDVTDNVAVGAPQSVSNLAAGATTTLTFSWNTTNASLSTHTLTASHDLTDDNGANNQASTTSTVVTTPPPTGLIHIGDLDVVLRTSNGSTWSATVEITVHDENHQPLNGATVTGTWNPGGLLVSNTCTTGDGGGNGTCVVLNPSIKSSRKSATFTVNSVTMSGRTYAASANHDPDGDSDGTTIKISKP
jgi:CARDB protein